KFSEHNIEIILHLANVQLLQRRLYQANQQYERAYNLVPDHPEVLKKLAEMSFNSRKFQDAIQYASKLKSDQSDALLDEILGKSYVDQRDLKNELNHLHAAEKKDPQNAELIYGRSNAYSDLSNYKTSARYFEKTIQLDTSKAS